MKKLFLCGLALSLAAGSAFSQERNVRSDAKRPSAVQRTENIRDTRQERMQDRRENRQENRSDRREDRRENRQENRSDRRENGGENDQNRGENRLDRREDRKENRMERRQDRRENRRERRSEGEDDGENNQKPKMDLSKLPPEIRKRVERRREIIKNLPAEKKQELKAERERHRSAVKQIVGVEDFLDEPME